jgi:hypothetical protein
MGIMLVNKVLVKHNYLCITRSFQNIATEMLGSVHTVQRNSTYARNIIHSHSHETFIIF